MSLETINPPQTQNVGDDDGSGDARDWRTWQEEVNGPEQVTGGCAFSMHDVGRAALLQYRHTGAFDGELSTDRLMLRHHEMPHIVRSLGGAGLRFM